MSDLYDKQHDAEIVRLNDRITELEASLADSNEALQVMGLKLSHAEADRVRLDWIEDNSYSLPYKDHGAGPELDLSRPAIDALMRDQSHSANTVGDPTPVMDAAPACEPERSVSESIAAGHPCFDPDGPPDHDWEYVDDSFSHEFGTEICGHYECARCDAIKPE